MRAETTDDPLDEGLEKSCCCEGVAKTHTLMFIVSIRVIARVNLAVENKVREMQKLTAALPSQKLLNHQPEIIDIMKNGTKKLIAALMVVLIYSVIYG